MNALTMTRVGLASALAAMLAMAALPARADTLAWTGITHVTAQNPNDGTFKRQGIALFKNGDVAAMVIDGQVMSRTTDVMTYTVRIVYTFDDGSTLIQEGQGRNEGVPPKTLLSGAGKLVGGTGRWAGVSGTTESKGRGVTAADNYSDFTAEVKFGK